MSRLPSAAQGNRSQAAGHEPAACDLVGADEAGRLNASDAEQLLDSLGFLLVPGPPFDGGPAYLMVALRRVPTLSHFDPARIAMWTPSEHGPVQITLEWPLRSLSQDYSWGLIEITDRLGAVNRFASFGGAFSTIRDGDINAVLFRSAAPILSAGGHSGPPDPLGTNATAFFGVLRAAAGNDPRSGDVIRASSPNALYAAFLAHTLALYAAPRAELINPRLISMLRQERSRLQRQAGDDQKRGDRVATIIGPSHPIATNKEAGNG